MFSFSQHNITNPIIEVNGDRATGIWYIMGPWTYAENDDEKWLALRYDDDYVKGQRGVEVPTLTGRPADDCRSIRTLRQ